VTAFETALIAAVRVAVADPEADVYWRDGSSAWHAPISYELSRVSLSARGKDVRTLGTVTAGSAPETIRGNRVAVIQVKIDAPTQDAATELADVLKAGIRASECEALFNAVNASAARPRDVRSVPYTDKHGDVRSAAVLEIAFNLTRSVTVGTVPIVAQIEVTGEVGPEDPPREIGPILVELD
jgi:hypothetical protein